MNLDALTIAALRQEVETRICPGRVQQVVQITAQRYGLEIYAQQQRNYLIFDAAPQQASFYLQSEKPRRGADSPTPIIQLLKKYLDGGILQTLEQPGLERLVNFNFSGPAGSLQVVMELIGTRSNLILLDEEKRVLALARPMLPQKNRRVLMPGRDYTLPPPQQHKLHPSQLTRTSLRTLLQDAPAGQPLSKVIPRQLLGFSPLLAGEALHRAYGRTNLTAADVDEVDSLLGALQALAAPLQTQIYQPHALRNDVGQITAVAPVTLTHRPEAEAVPSLSAALAETGSNEDAYAAARQPLQKQLDRAENRLQRRLVRLAQDAADLKDPEALKQKGDALLAYSFQVEARQTQLEVPWVDDELLVIELDPTLSASENAQRYYNRYQKARRAAEIIPQQRAQILLQLDYLEQLRLDLELADSRPEIEAVGAEIKAAGFERADGRARPEKAGQKKTRSRRGGKQPTRGTRPMKLQAPDGHPVWVGKNANQNAALLFDIANPNDIWLHARDIPGSHVIIPTASGPPSEATLQWAAELAAYYSRARQEAYVDVSYTLKKHVRPIKGGGPGQVTYRNEQVLRVSPAPPDKD